jgi:hypothetical protein
MIRSADHEEQTATGPSIDLLPASLEIYSQDPRLIKSAPVMKIAVRSTAVFLA